jgi:membrane associated rhomboid family serine protease
VPIIFFFYLVEVPAWVFLGVWLFLQFFNGAFALVVDSREFAGIAWWAHVGGFIGGMVLLWLFRIGLPRDRRELHG